MRTVEERTASCQNTDWHRYGVNDGKLGVSSPERQPTFNDCAQLGYPIDLAVYNAGRSEGLVSYCTAESGYQAGYDGRRYRNVCPVDLEPDFLQGYERGRRDRPAYALHPSVRIGIGSRGSHIGIGLGIGLFHLLGVHHGHGHYHGHRRHRHW